MRYTTVKIIAYVFNNNSYINLLGKLFFLCVVMFVVQKKNLGIGPEQFSPPLLTDSI